MTFQHAAIRNNFIIFSSLITTACTKTKGNQFVPGQSSYWFIQALCTHGVAKFSIWDNSWVCCLVKSFAMDLMCSCMTILLSLKLSKRIVLLPAYLLLGWNDKKKSSAFRGASERSWEAPTTSRVTWRGWLSGNLFWVKWGESSHSLWMQNSS